MIAATTMEKLMTADGRRPRVALVGGGPSGMMVAAMLAEQFGCSAISAPTGSAVMELLASADKPDLVVVDLAAPGMEALVATAVAGALRGRKGPPVVALVGAGAAGLSGYASALTKPYSPRELYGAMRAALDSARDVILPTFA